PQPVQHRHRSAPERGSPAMNPEIILKHEFVEFIPDELEQGTIYISIRFATASHLCICGCGNKVVTPIRPTDWLFIFDGKTVSLDPSIGNWSFQCQSHYWIRKNHVKWAPKWSREQIERGRRRDRGAKQQYCSGRDVSSVTDSNAAALPAKKLRRRFWQHLKWWS
ncbi:MAG: DUF6527 family protein, partial [Candidatus Micrarchaeaceae archaeon]